MFSRASINKIFSIVVLGIVVLFKFSASLVSDQHDSDYQIYRIHYEFSSQLDLYEAILSPRWEYFYDTTVWIFSKSGVDFELFVFFGALLLSVSYFFLGRIITGGSISALIATLFFCNSQFFDSFTTVALRQNLSFSILLIAGAAFINGLRRQAAIAGIAAALFHSSAVIFVLAMILASLSSKATKGLIIFYLLVWFLYAINVIGLGVEIFLRPAVILAGYETILNHTSYSVGTKSTFLAASLISIIPGILLGMGWKGPPNFWILHRFVLIVNALYMLVSGFPAHDRIAIVGWSMAPILAVAAFCYVALQPLRSRRGV